MRGALPLLDYYAAESHGVTGTGEGGREPDKEGPVRQERRAGPGGFRETDKTGVPCPARRPHCQQERPPSGRPDRASTSS